VKHMQRFSSFSPELLHRIGQIDTRNQRILQHGNKQQKALVFACDVAQAEWLAYGWRRKYQNAEIARAITAQTPYALRRKWLSEFMNPDSPLKILVNVGVLTTGFDAPKVERLILARPTMSRILFEQMVGRGLRGPKFGGYPQCTVIDIVDNFTNFGTIQAAGAFEKDWLIGKRSRKQPRGN
jgi:DNA repair protein RadD